MLTTGFKGLTCFMDAIPGKVCSLQKSSRTHVSVRNAQQDTPDPDTSIPLQLRMGRTRHAKQYALGFANESWIAPHALFVHECCTLWETLKACNNQCDVISSYFILQPQSVSFHNNSYGRLLWIVILADLQSAYMEWKQTCLPHGNAQRLELQPAPCNRGSDCGVLLDLSNKICALQTSSQLAQGSLTMSTTV